MSWLVALLLWLRRAMAEQLVALAQFVGPRVQHGAPEETVIAAVRARFPDAPVDWLQAIARRAPHLAGDRLSVTSTETRDMSGIVRRSRYLSGTSRPAAPRDRPGECPEPEWPLDRGDDAKPSRRLPVPLLDFTGRAPTTRDDHLVVNSPAEPAKPAASKMAATEPAPEVAPRQQSSLRNSPTTGPTAFVQPPRPRTTAPCHRAHVAISSVLRQAARAVEAPAAFRAPGTSELRQAEALLPPASSAKPIHPQDVTERGVANASRVWLATHSDPWPPLPTFEPSVAEAWPDDKDRIRRLAHDQDMT
jgi:hypothetical protein